MSIPEGVRTNFETLVAAAKAGDLACLECKDAQTGDPRYVICAVGSDGEQFLFTPFGHMESEMNPYERYTPPED